MNKQLRPYQAIAVKECLSALKESDAPVLLMASVGSGKSLMLGEILLLLQKKGKRALCIVNNAELVRSNADAFAKQGGNPSIYCSSLGQRDIANPVVFGTPQSIVNGIKKGRRISHVLFNLIVVDEAHCINYVDHTNTFMRILRHYKQNYPEMRVLGGTGTNFRYKGEPIVGDGCLFKKQVGNITTAWLIENNYLAKPKFEVDPRFTIDFSSVKKTSMGKFDTKQMEAAIDKSDRLTGQILQRLVRLMDEENRFGCFIFCCSKKHCDEAMLSLPMEKSAVITGDTPQKERLIILDKARKGEIKYLVNVQVLTVGVDVPGYDTLLFIRPTESLVLAVQMIGRALRLFPGKKYSLIIDCAGNIERHADWDDPLILDALKQTIDSNQDLIFPCPACETMNSQHARRCRGIVDKKRCDFYFEWKDCPECNEKNDLAARECRRCGHELIDPNCKITAKPFIKEGINLLVHEVDIAVKDVPDDKIWIAIKYVCQEKNSDKSITLFEQYSPLASEKAKNMFYGNFIRKHIENSSRYYPLLTNKQKIIEMLRYIRKPTHINARWSGSEWVIARKMFDSQARQDNQ